jgi:hypothetical protein
LVLGEEFFIAPLANTTYTAIAQYDDSQCFGAQDEQKLWFFAEGPYIFIPPSAKKPRR